MISNASFFAQKLPFKMKLSSNESYCIVEAFPFPDGTCEPEMQKEAPVSRKMHFIVFGTENMR